MNKRENRNRPLKIERAEDRQVWTTDEVATLLRDVSNQLAQRSTQQQAYNTAVERLSVIESDVSHIKQDVESLCKVVRDGNGQPSMIHRLTNLEQVVENNRKDIEEVRAHANTIVAAKALSKSQVMAGLAGMIITALLSSMALIATLLK